MFKNNTTSDGKAQAMTARVERAGLFDSLKRLEHVSDMTFGDARSFVVDPDFDASEHAFYYLRALEIPTPRWSTRDAVALGVAIPEGLPATIQERAWSSPIWYAPAAQ